MFARAHVCTILISDLFHGCLIFQSISLQLLNTCSTRTKENLQLPQKDTFLPRIWLKNLTGKVRSQTFIYDNLKNVINVIKMVQEIIQPHKVLQLHRLADFNTTLQKPTFNHGCNKNIPIMVYFQEQIIQRWMSTRYLRNLKRPRYCTQTDCWLVNNELKVTYI